MRVRFLQSVPTSSSENLTFQKNYGIIIIEKVEEIVYAIVLTVMSTATSGTPEF